MTRTDNRWEPGLPDREHRLEEAADRAIAALRPVDVGDLVLVPAVVLAEEAANGGAVSIYRHPVGRR